MDAKSGEILAMVNVPSFNPNNRQGVKNENFRNRAITDTLEPGSTIKAFTIASALETGSFKPDSVIDTSPGWMRVGHSVVKDEKDNGLLSISQILQYSSNMGAAKIVLALPPNQLWSLLQRVGFGENTGIGFPGEQEGVLIKHNPWGQFILATLSLVMECLPLPCKLPCLFCTCKCRNEITTFADQAGKACHGVQVLNPNIAKQMLTLLESVFAKEEQQQGFLYRL